MEKWSSQKGNEGCGVAFSTGVSMNVTRCGFARYQPDLGVGSDSIRPKFCFVVVAGPWKAGPPQLLIPSLVSTATRGGSALPVIRDRKKRVSLHTFPFSSGDDWE